MLGAWGRVRGVRPLRLQVKAHLAFREGRGGGGNGCWLRLVFTHHLVVAPALARHSEQFAEVGPARLVLVRLVGCVGAPRAEEMAQRRVRLV